PTMGFPVGVGAGARLRALEQAAPLAAFESPCRPRAHSRGACEALFTRLGGWSRARAMGARPHRYAYFHGFRSSPSAKKGNHLRERLAAEGVELLVPDLNQPSFAALS